MLVPSGIFEDMPMFRTFYPKLPIFLRQKLCQHLEKSMQADSVPQRISDAYSLLHEVDPEMPTLSRPSPFAGPQWYYERISEEFKLFYSIFKEYPDLLLFVQRLGVHVDKDEIDFGLLDHVS